MKRIKKIARELGVTVAYLAGEEDMFHTDREKSLAQGWRELPEADQDAVMMMVARLRAVRQGGPPDA